jgi:hypothetical protein
MKYVPDRTGRFAERPHYEAAELDTLFERVVVGFLKSRHDKVEFPISTEDVTVLIEKDSDDLDVYADLSSYSGNVEGVTEFWPGRRPKVRISAHLSEGENRENRFRTTLTHEFGHVKLHGYLFALAPTGPGLFGATAKPDVIACKRDTILSAARTDWMEWQAGYACGAVLMPASYVKQLADGYKRKASLYGPVPAASLHGQALIESVVSTFQVSRDAARVRLSVLGVLGTAHASASLFS